MTGAKAFDDLFAELTSDEAKLLEERFLYHNPSSDEIVRAHEFVSTATLKLARDLSSLIPNSRGLSLALTKLEEARMWANQAIACEQKLRKDGEAT